MDDINLTTSSSVIHIQIPQIEGDPRSISMSASDVVFILGANGTGKSSLMQYNFNKYKDKACWVSALRQTFFRRDFALSLNEKISTETAIRSRAASTELRWTDEYAGVKPNIIITNLINMVQKRSRQISSLIDQDKADDALCYAQNRESILDTINQLLRQSNIPISIELNGNETILARKFEREPYSIAQLSDGERSIVLIAAQILTAPPDTLVLIDEPEQHLNHSTMSIFLNLLFKKRSDCMFVIATHDADLPMNSPHSKTILVRDCTYDGVSAQGWDIDIVEYGEEVNEEVLRDILGSRRKILFVEGDQNSLDRKLYDLIFPDVSVIPKGSFKNVEDAVKGIRATNHLHRVDAYGIVDRDGRSDKNVEELQEQKVYPLPFYSVESIYYHQEILKKIYERHAILVGGDPNNRLEKATSNALDAIEKSKVHLAEVVAKHRIQEKISNFKPDLNTADLFETTVCFSIEDVMLEELELLDDYIQNRDLESIIARYPIHESSALDKLIHELKIGQSNYEAAVCELLKDDQQILDLVRSWFNPLPNAILDALRTSVWFTSSIPAR